MRRLVPRTALASALGCCSVLVIASAASATPQAPLACPPEDPTYSFTNVASSVVATDLVSAYITGPGTITYNESRTATASASMTATVSAEAGIVFAKASTSIGATVGASYASSGGFSYSLAVAAGERRRLHLYQSSRSFTVTKQSFNPGQCTWVTSYSDGTNAPLTQRADEWHLEA